MQAILSLQQACAAQIATPQTIGLAIGTVMGSTSLSYVFHHYSEFIQDTNVQSQSNGRCPNKRGAGREIRIPSTVDLLRSESLSRKSSPGHRTLGAESGFVGYCLAVSLGAWSLG